jgi:CMP-N,N'-diacetyllegionaminic acid synthase
MIGGQRVLAVVAARGGSKGVPRKNVLPVAGRPLLAWSLQAARESRYVDRVIVSSEDAEILALAGSFGADVPFTRPPELARDDTPGIEPVLHAVSALQGFDIVVLLQPTSPLRTSSDVDACLERLEASAAPSCVSVCEAECHPYLTYGLSDGGALRGFVTDRSVSNLRRQEFPFACRLNGAVYAARISWLVAARSFVSAGTVGYVMPQERSLDIDTREDMALAEVALSGMSS